MDTTPEDRVAQLRGHATTLHDAATITAGYGRTILADYLHGLADELTWRANATNGTPS